MARIDITDQSLQKSYPDPRDRQGSRIWVRANFVTAPNGVVKVNGKSEPISGSADKKVFNFLRSQTDAILVGAETARVETYSSPVSKRSDGSPPLLIVVTNSLDINANALFLNEDFPPLIATSSIAIKNNTKIVDQIGSRANIEAHGEESVDFAELFQTLLLRGIKTVLCEGGPTVFSTLLLEGLIDELCLTISPQLSKGDPTGIAHLGNTTVQMNLQAHFEIDGFIFCRYAISRD